MKILPVFIPSQGCPYKCVYCDQQVITNTTAIDLKTIEENIKNFCTCNQDQYKEIAFYGGTFTNLQQNFMEKLLSFTDPHINKKVGLRISTRPDLLNQNQLLSLKQRGLKTVELGIQSFSDTVLKLSGRLYTRETALSACEIVRNADLTLGIQLMPGLPGFNSKTLTQTISDVLAIDPDLVRIYPTIVLKGTALEKLYLEGKYKPLSLQKAIDIASEMITIFEKNNIKVIKTGLHSDIPETSIVAGPYHHSFGELIRIELMLKKIIANYQRAQTFVISKKDISLFKGFKQNLIFKLKKILDLNEIPVIIDQHLEKGEIAFTEKSARLRW